ncbi:MAG: hypothetical protein IKP57_04400 [Paludibacteraceae bacterium]|nr:hypothetical protein [Paludibacteraceae bacterium]
MEKKIIASPYVYGTISTLLKWASQNKKRGFFIALCDDDKTHVAFQNLNKVSTDASAVIGCDPELVAAFESIGVGVSCASEDFLKNPKWMKICNELPIDDETWRWIGFDYKDEKAYQYDKHIIHPRTH